MSEKHLATGDPLPPLKDGELYLFSMKYCPFVERSRLVLAAKGVQYQTINCHLIKKPEFLVERNPSGTVPVIEKDGKVLYESVLICNLLEEWYPDVPLYPKDPYLKAKDQLVVAKYNNKVIPQVYKYWKAVMTNADQQEALSQLSRGLTEFSQELKRRGTTFLSGNDGPGMVDYLCWPWIERLAMEKSKEALDSNPDLTKYYNDMMKTKIVQEITLPIQDYSTFYYDYYNYKDGKEVFDYYRG